MALEGVTPKSRCREGSGFACCFGVCLWSCIRPAILERSSLGRRGQAQRQDIVIVCSHYRLPGSQQLFSLIDAVLVFV